MWGCKESHMTEWLTLSVSTQPQSIKVIRKYVYRICKIECKTEFPRNVENVSEKLKSSQRLKENDSPVTL